jgi:hypothetical protein
VSEKPELDRKGKIRLMNMMKDKRKERETEAYGCTG